MSECKYCHGAFPLEEFPAYDFDIDGYEESVSIICCPMCGRFIEEVIR